MNARVAELLEQGQSIWQDDIARGRSTSGKLAATIEDVGVRGLTSNPTIFEKAISGGTDYDAQIGELLRRQSGPRRSSKPSRSPTSATPAISSARSTTRATAATVSARSRSPRTLARDADETRSRSAGSGTRSTGRT